MKQATASMDTKTISPAPEQRCAVSIVLPCYNEALNLPALISKLKSQKLTDFEILLVDDCSTDNSVELAKAESLRVIQHRTNMGNGACIKTGARHARGDIIVFMDADGQHDPEDIQRLLEKIDNGYDMAIGARSSSSQASILRRIANGFYNDLATFITNFKVKDLTSGFRAVHAGKFREFMHLYPNGFSYPTTSTMAFIRSGYQIAYVPIVAHKREGKSHISLTRDGVRFLLIIFKIGTLYSPLKLFIPISLIHLTVGVSYYLYTYTIWERFTNMSALLIIAAMLIFLIGLVSEQITTLLYHKKE